MTLDLRGAWAATAALLLLAAVPAFADDEPAAAEGPAFDQAAALAELRASIAGREEEPAEAVFRNIDVLKGVPAGRLLRIMEMGYARSLGVDCKSCHVPGNWESDDKHEKVIARGMARMTREINERLLTGIPELMEEAKEHDRQPTVNCTTCHHGQKVPALNLEAPATPAATPPAESPASETPPAAETPETTPKAK